MKRDISLPADPPVTRDRSVTISFRDYEWDEPKLMADFTLRVTIGDDVEIHDVTILSASIYFGKEQIVIDGSKSIAKIERWIKHQESDRDFQTEIREQWERERE